jgi:hypothetical protein
MTVVPTYTAQIYVAGDLETARSVCRDHCLSVGLCVTVEALEFIYTGGAEAGVRVGLINYPRFPSTPEAIFSRAWQLGELLMEAMAQHSFSVVATDQTRWFSRREEA